ncbi:hypothetical protein BH24CHL9_BH24CHL9_12810 [soil metagenome]
MLSLRSVTFSYPATTEPSLRDVSLDLLDGEVTGLLGPSEAGKSTLCLVLAGLAPRVAGGTMTGRLEVDGEDFDRGPTCALPGHVALVFQEPSSGLSLVAGTVYEEVAFGPANLGLPLADILERVEEALACVGIGKLAARDPCRLSGGQQQLVAIASALVMRPAVLLLDEPTSHLDARGVRLVHEAVGAVAAAGTAVLMAEPRTAALEGICTRLVVMAAGRIVAVGPLSSVLA